MITDSDYIISGFFDQFITVSAHCVTLYIPSIRLFIRLLDSHAYFLTASRHMNRHMISIHSLSYHFTLVFLFYVYPLFIQNLSKFHYIKTYFDACVYLIMARNLAQSMSTIRVKKQVSFQ